MKIEKREPIKCFLLSIVTCGIYGIIWAIKMVDDVVKMNDENDSGLVEKLLVLFLPFVGFYLTEKKFVEACAKRNIPHSDNSVLYLILGFVFGIANYFLIQSELNKVADIVNGVAPAYGYTPQYPPYQAAPQQTPYQAPQQTPYQAAPQYQPQQPPYQAAPQYQPQQNPYQETTTLYNQNNNEQPPYQGQ